MMKMNSPIEQSDPPVPAETELDQSFQIEVDRYYANLRDEDLAEVLSSDRPRKPRVLLLGAEHDSSLDAAEAFEQIGCESCVLKNPSAIASILKVLRDFQPDMVIQINHLRAEHGDLFPANLPFVCWIQDDLPHLANVKAGKSITSRDFVLAERVSDFAEHRFPRKQLINLPKLARVPIRPTHWNSGDEDLVHVSDGSMTLNRAMQDLLRSWDAEPDARRLVEHVAIKLCAIYDDGASIAVHREVQELIANAQKAAGIQIASAAMEHRLIESIFNEVNSALYRQQALGWAADVARDLGLKFSLYGRGWDVNPRFAAYARGPIAAGAALEDLTRRAKFNLQVEPYACFTQARLFSGLFAGGFFLIRDHPFNHLSQELLSFLNEHGCAAAENRKQAREMIDTAHAEQLEQLLTRCRAMDGQSDCIELTRDWERSRLLVGGEEALPRINEIVFDSPQSLQKRIERFLNDEDLRHQVVHDQRLSTESRLSYQTGLRRVLREISEKISAEIATGGARKVA